MPYMREMACFESNFIVKMYFTSDVFFPFFATIFSIFFFRGPPLLYTSFSLDLDKSQE